MASRSTARGVLAVAAAAPCAIILLPVFLAALFLLVFVSAVRAIGRLLEPAFMTWPELIEFDRTLGWKPRPGLDGHYLADLDDVFRIVTDGEGWPGRRSLDQSDVVVIGDSFAFGYGVDTNRSFAEVRPRPHVKAVGAPGYSMVHGVRLMEQFGDRLRGKLVVWFAYLENDLQDNLAPEMRRYRAPFVRLDRARGGWTIVDEHIRPGKWECSNLDVRRLFPKFCVPGPLADRAYAACDYLIERARSSCDRVGAHLVVVTIPHPMQLTRTGLANLARLSGKPEMCDADLPDRRVAQSCRRYGVPLIVGKEHLTRGDYKRREGIHWNQQGHRQMARLLGQLYESFRSGRLEEYVPSNLEQATSHIVARLAARRPAPARSPAAGGLGAGQ
jgi:hypothetical protein